MSDVPVAIFAFNRPANTRKVFEAVRAAKPARLFLCLDGPRTDNVQDSIKRQEIIALFQNVDWDCEVHRNYSDVNLGCRERMGSGISWVFSNVDRAILLEDDCLPSPDFFRFCEEMLDRYADNPTIGMIAGHREHLLSMKVKEDYYFDRLPTIWGWATWRRAWDRYDSNISDWPIKKKSRALKKKFKSSRQEKAIEYLFDSLWKKSKGSWDSAWAYSMIINNLLCIHPKHNLIQNIGCGVDSTHTKSRYSPWSKLSYGTLPKIVQHPKSVLINEKEQMKTFKCLYAPTIRYRIMQKMYKLFANKQMK